MCAYVWTMYVHTMPPFELINSVLCLFCFYWNVRLCVCMNYFSQASTLSNHYLHATHTVERALAHWVIKNSINFQCVVRKQNGALVSNADSVVHNVYELWWGSKRHLLKIKATRGCFCRIEMSMVMLMTAETLHVNIQSNKFHSNRCVSSIEIVFRRRIFC